MRAKYKLRHFSNAIVGHLKKVQIKQSKFYASSLFLCTWIGPFHQNTFPHGSISSTPHDVES